MVHWPETLRNLPGMYQLIATDAGGEPLELDRIGGKDPGGLLYIGQSRHLRGRLTSIRNALVNDRRLGPMPAVTYQSSMAIQKLVPVSQIMFRFDHCDACRKAEADELKYYFDIFGEVPPMNGRAEFITTIASRPLNRAR